MTTLRTAFGVPTGWSDHSLGIELPIAATAIGASLVEKHLTLDRERPGPDHRASLEPDAFRAMVAGIRSVESALGSGEKRPAAAELPIAAVARRSLHWRRSLDAGVHGRGRRPRRAATGDRTVAGALGRCRRSANDPSGQDRRLVAADDLEPLA